MRRDLPAGGFLDFEPAFLSSEEAERLHGVLLEELAWESREIVLFGRRIVQPRLIAWAGTIPYRYSGQTLEVREFGPVLGQIVERVAARVGVPYNHVLANRYRNGMDSMGMHSDDEPELGDDPVVSSVSLGAARRFVLVPRRKGERISLALTSGSLLVMGGTCQKNYRHGIPRDAGTLGERISLTLRHVRRPPATD